MAVNYSKVAEKSYVDDKIYALNKVLVINGYNYNVLKVGNQIWMTENLDEELGTLNLNEWYYQNNETTYGRNGRKYGRLYTIENLNANLNNKLGSLGLSAWHLPNSQEVDTLINYIGGNEIAGFRLKSDNYWNEDGFGIDYYGFKANPTGICKQTSFYDEGNYSYIWTSSSKDTTNQYCLTLSFDSDSSQIKDFDKGYGLSVRLVLTLNSDGSLPDGNGLVDLSSVNHDDTLSGDGTSSSPLSVNEMVGAVDIELIGGRKYRTVTIGNQTWLAENLDFTFSGLEVGQSETSDTEPRANYYDNDEATYGVNGNKYGLLYNWIAVMYLQDHKSTLIPGWHVPTSEEWDELATSVGGSSVAGTKLKSTTGWNSGNVDGSYGFDAFPSGYYNGSFYDVGSYANFWTSSEYSGSNAYRRSLSTSASMDSNNLNKYYQCSVRLVKDYEVKDGKKGLVPTPRIGDAKKVLSGAGTFVNQPVLQHTDRNLNQVQPDGSLKKIVEIYTRQEVDEKIENFNTFSVTIGTRNYRCEKIGNQLWMAENLDYTFEGLTIGSDGTPTDKSAWYYNNDKDTYGIDGTRKCGLLYNWYAAKYLEDNKSTLLPSGWHLPSRDEYTTLISESGISRAGHYLKAEDNYVGNWPTNWNGIDEHNIAVLPSGYRNDSGNFVNVSENAYLWTSNEVNTDNAYAMMFSRLSENLMSASYSKVCGIPVRLVLTLNDDGSVPSGYQVNKALATKEYVDGLVGNVEALLAAL